MNEENNTNEYKIATSPGSSIDFATAKVVKDPVNGGYSLALPGVKSDDKILGSREPYGETLGPFKPTTGPGPVDENGKLDPRKFSPFFPELPKEGTVMGDWAMVVEDTFRITGRGPVNTGRLLYGKPEMGDEITWLDCRKKSVVRGVEHYCISYWYGPGGLPGILMVEELPRGTLILGHKNKSK